MRGEVRETNERNISIEGKAKRVREKNRWSCRGSGMAKLRPQRVQPGDTFF